MSQTEIEIVWREPPPKEVRSKWLDLLAPLRDRPGNWAMIRTDSPKRVSNLRQRLGKTTALKGQFEFRAHKVNDDVGELYVRFVPIDERAT